MAVGKAVGAHGAGAGRRAVGVPPAINGATGRDGELRAAQHPGVWPESMERVVFDTPGAGSFTVPAGWSLAREIAQGAGGGGAVAFANGGSGGLAVRVVPVTPGQSIPYTVGEPGAGGIGTGTDGTSGGASTCDGMTASGGTPGLYTGAVSGTGGTATGGFRNYSGAPGPTGVDAEAPPPGRNAPGSVAGLPPEYPAVPGKTYGAGGRRGNPGASQLGFPGSVGCVVFERLI